MKRAPSNRGLWPGTWRGRRWLGQRLTRQFLRVIRGQINKRSHDNRHLLHVRFLNALINIHVGVMCARVIVHRILDKLKARKPHGVIGEMVGSTSVADGLSGHPQALEWLHPAFEDWGDRLIAL